MEKNMLSAENAKTDANRCDHTYNFSTLDWF